MKELPKALIKAQSAMGKLVRDAKNPHFHSDYATLHQVIEVAKLELFRAGIAVFESTIIKDGQTVQQLSLIHSESGEQWDSEWPLICKDPSNPQQLMSCQTYSRRALWTAAAGLAPTDDDGNAAAEAPKPPQKAKKAQAKAKPSTGGLTAIKADLKASAEYLSLSVFDFLSAELDRDINAKNVNDLAEHEILHVREVVAQVMGEKQKTEKKGKK